MEETFIKRRATDVSVRRVEDVIDALWGKLGLSPPSVNCTRMNMPTSQIVGTALCKVDVYVDRIYLRCSWGGEFGNIALLQGKVVEDGTGEAFTHSDFPSEHWTCNRTNNVIERLNRETCCSIRVIGSLPNGNSVLMLACIQLCHMAGTQCGNKKYNINMKKSSWKWRLSNTSVAG